MSKLIRRAFLPAVLVLADAFCTAHGAELTMSQNCLVSNDLVGEEKSISPSGTGTTNDPYTYTFMTAGGLEMGSYRFYNASTPRGT